MVPSVCAAALSIVRVLYVGGKLRACNQVHSSVR